MHIGRINKYNTNFGAKILLDGEKAKALVNYSDKQKAGEILDRFEKFHPDEVIKITAANVSDFKPYKMMLLAENLNTNEDADYFCEDDVEKTNKPHNCYNLYKFLEYLLNRNQFSEFEYFWGKEPVKDYSNIDLKEHKVFLKG